MTSVPSPAAAPSLSTRRSLTNMAQPRLEAPPISGSTPIQVPSDYDNPIGVARAFNIAATVVENWEEMR